MDLFIIFYDSWHLGHQPLIIPAFQPMNSFPWGAGLGRKLGRSLCAVLLQFYRQQALYWDCGKGSHLSWVIPMLEQIYRQCAVPSRLSSASEEPFKKLGTEWISHHWAWVGHGLQIMGTWCRVLGLEWNIFVFDILYLWFFILDYVLRFSGLFFHPWFQLKIYAINVWSLVACKE